MAFLWIPWNVLTGCLEEKRTLSIHCDLIAIGTTSLDTKYAFYGFNDDVIDSEYHCHTARFSKNKTSPHCYVYIFTVVIV